MKKTHYLVALILAMVTIVAIFGTAVLANSTTDHRSLRQQEIDCLRAHPNDPDYCK